VGPLRQAFFSRPLIPRPGFEDEPVFGTELFDFVEPMQADIGVLRFEPNQRLPFAPMKVD
jgi:hypothetical protein